MDGNRPRSSIVLSHHEHASGHARLKRTIMPRSLREFDRRAISQDLCYTLCKLSGIISECNHGISTHIFSMLNHTVKSFLTRLLTNRGVRFDVATHDLLKPIVADILDETLPPEVTLFDLAAGTPLLWEEQRGRLGGQPPESA
jgi:hypothetical protein